MAVQRRDIFAGNQSADNGAKAVTYTPGGDDSLSAREPYTAPLSVTDQASAATEAERGGLESAWRDAQRAAGAYVYDGATGAQVGRGPDSFATRGDIATDGGVGDVVAATPLVTRTDGADDPRGSAYGKSIG